MTVLDDMWTIIDKMIDVREVGVYNLTNPGVAEHNKILTLYKERVDPTHIWNDISYEEQITYIKSERSNNEMDTTKLETFCREHNIELLSIWESIKRVFARRYT